MSGRRLRRNLVLSATTAGLLAGGFLLAHSRDLVWTWSMSTAYASLVLLAVSLCIGPLAVVRGERSPANTALRRDVSIWAGVIALAHVIIGVNVHMRGKMREYFLYPPDEPHRLFLRHDSFGIANYVGLAATLIVALLLALSNDASLRSLGTARWKRWQQSAYVLAALVVAHGVAFQLIEKRTGVFVVLFALLCIVPAGVQWRGHRVVVRRKDLVER